MNTDTPRTNEALAAILERDRELSEKNAPEALVKLCRAMECKAEELNHQLARSQEAATIWYRRCFSEDAEWNLGELTKLTEERDELRDMLQEEQRLHIQTLNERDEAREYADKLAGGLPDGMLPKDVEVLREANLGLAMELAEARGALASRLELYQFQNQLLKKRSKDKWAAIDQRDRLAEACRLLMAIVGPLENQTWATDEQIDRAYNAAENALATLNQTEL